MKKLCGYTLFTLLILMFAVSLALAQTGGVKGTITDDQTGATLPGANVFLERTSFGAASDPDGLYTISNVPAGTYTLIVHYVGYVQYKQEVTVAAGETMSLDIKMKPSSVQLNPVVVTAIGEQAEREKMGTSVSTIEAQAINTAGAHDVITSLAALAPGVNTTESAGDPGAATRIVLRGVRSLQNNNQPLIVVDGVPVFDDVSTGGGVGGTAAIGRMVDFNPDDIASVEVYNGPATSSLWGSRAANGVISITTKTGGQTGSKKLGVTIRSRTYSDQLLRSMPLQTTFGQGSGGVYSQGTSLSWGDPIFLRAGSADVLSRTNYQYALISQKNSTQTFDHGTDIFRKPVTEDYGVTLRGGDEWGDFYLDVDQLKQQGIILSNSDLARTSLRGNATRRFTEDVVAKISAAYIKTNTTAIQQGSNISGLLLGNYRTPPDFDNSAYLVNYVSPTGAITYGTQRTYRNAEGNPAKGPGYDNPFFVIYNLPTSLITNRLMGTAELTYNAAKWFNIMYRVGADYYTDRQANTFPAGDASFSTGDTYRAVNSNYQINTDLTANANRPITDDINGSLTVGFHLDHLRSEGTSVDAQRFILTDAPPTFSNALDYFPGESVTIIRTAALYGEARLDMYKQIFVTVTGRDESASTYGPSAKQTYFYPSASVAWQFTQFSPVKDMFKDNSILSFGKLRLSYGEAANRPGAYLTKTYYVNANPGNGWGEALNGIYYNGAAYRSSQLGNSDLSPELTTELEFGADLRFWNDRISLSATQYSDKTSDALLSLSIAPSSGYSSRVANAAKIENTGTELQLIADWLRIEPFSWSTTVNWSHNKNMVTDLAGVQSVFLAGFTDPSSRAILNQPVGVLYGTRWARNADGSQKLDANGFPVEDASPGVLGNPNPDWRAGIINTLRYDRLSLNVVFDIKHGGDVWNGTKGAIYYFGTHKDESWWTTLSASDASTLKDWTGTTPAQQITAGKKIFTQNADGTVSFRGYVHNFGGGNVIVDQNYFTSGPGSGFTGPSEQFIEKGGFVRLREVTLSYLLPLQFLGLQSATVSVTGRNLKLWTDYTGIDPETNLTGPSNGQGLDYFDNPSVTSWIVSIQLDY